MWRPQTVKLSGTLRTENRFDSTATLIVSQEHSDNTTIRDSHVSCHSTRTKFNDRAVSAAARSSSLELFVDGPQTARLDIQTFQAVAENIFIWSVGPECSVNTSLLIALWKYSCLLTYLLTRCFFPRGFRNHRQYSLHRHRQGRPGRVSPSSLEYTGTIYSRKVVANPSNNRTRRSLTLVM